MLEVARRPLTSSALQVSPEVFGLSSFAGASLPGQGIDERRERWSHRVPHGRVHRETSCVKAAVWTRPSTLNCRKSRYLSAVGNVAMNFKLSVSGCTCR